MSQPYDLYRPADPAPRGAWPAAGDGYRVRRPQVADGPALWALVRSSSLDDNSPYAYLMLARYYADTCALAERDGELGGFVSAFIPPRQPDTLFIWQVGVSPRTRGRGLASRLILSVLARPPCVAVEYLEATVTPSNAASLALFRGLGRKLGAPCRESDCFPERLFPAGGHEAERLLRIGPIGRRELAELTQSGE